MVSGTDRAWKGGWGGPKDENWAERKGKEGISLWSEMGFSKDSWRVERWSDCLSGGFLKLKWDSALQRTLNSRTMRGKWNRVGVCLRAYSWHILPLALRDGFWRTKPSQMWKWKKGTRDWFFPCPCHSAFTRCCQPSLILVFFSADGRPAPPMKGQLRRKAQREKFAVSG